MEGIEKDVADLQEQCDAVLSLDKPDDRVDPPLRSEAQSSDSTSGMEESYEVNESPTSNKKKKKKKKNKKKNKEKKKIVHKPDFISESIWDRYKDFGNSVANFLADGLNAYTKGKLDNWDRDRIINLEATYFRIHKEEDKADIKYASEYIVRERMKDIKYFCCQFCNVMMYNYKQALIHFSSNGHGLMENAQKPIAVEIFRVILIFTSMRKLIGDNGSYNALLRIWLDGSISNEKYLPTPAFHEMLNQKYKYFYDFTNLSKEERSAMVASPINFKAKTVVERAMGEEGRKAMVELDNHFGEEETRCLYCNVNTGDREGFYAHSLTFFHVTTIEQNNIHCVLTLLLNVRRKDLAFPNMKEELDAMKWAEMRRRTINEPESIPEDIWNNFYKFGTSVADAIVDAIAIYETGDFANWDKTRIPNLTSEFDKIKGEMKRSLYSVCEYILVEKLKQKDFFCCELCKRVMFSYKLTIIHMTSGEHQKMETKGMKKSGLIGFRDLLNLFTKLPEKWREEDAEFDVPRGRRDVLKNFYHPDPEYMIELTANKFDDALAFKQGTPLAVAAAKAMKTFKDELGRRMMIRLSDHLAQAPTYCFTCKLKTGDRDRFYAHINSTYHLNNYYKMDAEEGLLSVSDRGIQNRLITFDVYAILISAHRRDLIDDVKVPTTKSVQSADSDSTSTEKRVIDRPDHIRRVYWRKFYDLGNMYAEFVLDALEIYAIGKYSNWNKERVKNIMSYLTQLKNEEKLLDRRELWRVIDSVCEYIIVARMKEKEFFCCETCQVTCYNYKQVLIHFVSYDHEVMDFNAKDTVLHDLRYVLNVFNKLPQRLAEKDAMTDMVRLSILGTIRSVDYRPTKQFITEMNTKYARLFISEGGSMTNEQMMGMTKQQLNASTTIMKLKSEKGEKAMSELHEYIGYAQTHCLLCGQNTGNRDEFYEHLVSYYHFHKDSAGGSKHLNGICVMTLLVNVHRKHLA